MQAICSKTIQPSLATESFGKAKVRSNILNDFRGLSGRIGILGGSFDPVHLGHVKIAEVVKTRLHLDCVVFLPTAQNPLKANNPSAAQHRLNMVELAITGHENFFVSPLEINSPEVRSTVEILRKIRAQVKPDTELFFIVGADILPQLHKWQRPHELLQLAQFVPVTRTVSSNALISADEFSAVEISELLKNFITIPEIPVSSSAVRAAASKEKSITEMVGSAVAQYIQAQGLYQNN